jgi:hypothetical protein
LIVHASSNEDRPAATAPLSASFRDPHGFVFVRDGRVLRQVNDAGRADYDLLLASGLYEELSAAQDLVAHEEIDLLLAAAPGAYRLLAPEQLPFISYPYEWSFSQLKDAALLTLRLQAAALRRGMSLRDATPYNVQFRGGRPVFIDTLSFGAHAAGQPWVAYRQFCEGFLAPLALMSCTDVRLQHLLRVYLDGIPLDLAASLLPLRTKARPGLLVHLHLHARAQRKGSTGSTAAPPSADRSRTMSGTAMTALVESLERTVRALDWAPRGTVWGDYSDATNYPDSAFAHTREIVAGALDRFAPAVVWDLGANDGTFSRLAAERKIRTLAFDVDPAAVEKSYRRVKADGEAHLLPLLLDLTNPSGGAGWANRERSPLSDRAPADMLLALALVHHLAIGHNEPLHRVAEYFAQLGRRLVIEVVPKQDSQVRRMLASRDDIFDQYTQAGFEAAFGRPFDIVDRIPVRDSERTIYIMEARAGV